MKNFVKYAEYYDILYRSKDYKKETDYVDRLIRRFSGKRARTLLDIGCGTGNHDAWFSGKGYKVVGIDRSREMIAIARKKAKTADDPKFYIRDVSRFNLRKKFDIAVSLFHVMSYLTTNETVMKSLRNIHKHLKKDGLFIFDFWYGPAVLKQGLKRRVKTVCCNNFNIRRISVPKISPGENTVDVYFKNMISSKRGSPIRAIRECHRMRYFFLPELIFMLRQASFSIVKSLEWLSGKEGLSPDSWSGVIIAKRNQRI